MLIKKIRSKMKSFLCKSLCQENNKETCNIKRVKNSDWLYEGETICLSKREREKNEEECERLFSILSKYSTLLYGHHGFGSADEWEIDRTRDDEELSISDFNTFFLPVLLCLKKMYSGFELFTKLYTLSDWKKGWQTCLFNNRVFYNMLLKSVKDFKIVPHKYLFVVICCLECTVSYCKDKGLGIHLNKILKHGVVNAILDITHSNNGWKELILLNKLACMVGRNRKMLELVKKEVIKKSRKMSSKVVGIRCNTISCIKDLRLIEDMFSDTFGKVDEGLLEKNAMLIKKITEE